MENEIKEIVNLIETHRQNAYRKINEELVLMYFEIGSLLYSKVKSGQWGEKIIEQIANTIRKSYPTVSGFSKRSLYQTIQFYETYHDNEIVRTLSAQISWSNNLLILRTSKTIDENEFYIRLCIKNNYSYRELDRQIKSSYYQRFLISNNLENNLPKRDLPFVLDCYSLEFLNLPKKYSEKDLRKAIIDNLKYFILEIGSDFSFVGEEFRIPVGNHDYFIDLLFYNRTYSCLVAFELKLGEFEPEYLSKMNFYLEVLDRTTKKESENPSVGIILCSSKDNAVVEYAMARNISPTVVATYETKLIDKKLLEKKIIQLRTILESKDE